MSQDLEYFIDRLLRCRRAKEEQDGLLHIGRILSTDMFERSRQVVYGGGGTASEGDEKLAEIEEIFLLQTRNRRFIITSDVEDRTAIDAQAVLHPEFHLLENSEESQRTDSCR